MGGLTFLHHPMIFVTKQNEEYATEDAADHRGRSCCPSVAAGMSLQSDCLRPLVYRQALTTAQLRRAGQLVTAGGGGVA